MILNRLQAQLYALATDPETFLTDPHPDDSVEFESWKCELDKRQGEISDLMVNNVNIRKNYSSLVPQKGKCSLQLDCPSCVQVCSWGPDRWERGVD